jgi:putative flippase GtrA
MKKVYDNAKRYILGSAISFFINISLTVFLHEYLGLKEEVAFACGLTAVLIINFFIFRFFIFDSNSAPLTEQFIHYSSLAVSFRLSEYLLFLLCHTYIGLDYKLVTIVTLAISAVAKFFAYRFLFNKKSTQR